MPRSVLRGGEQSLSRGYSELRQNARPQRNALWRAENVQGQFRQLASITVSHKSLVALDVSKAEHFEISRLPYPTGAIVELG